MRAKWLSQKKVKRFLLNLFNRKLHNQKVEVQFGCASIFFVLMECFLLRKIILSRNARNSRKFIAARWFYLPQITQITRIFPFFDFFATLKILFYLGKSLTYNKIRSFAAQKSLYGFTQILSLRDGFSRCSRRARTLRCSRFCYLVFFSRISFLSRNSRNARNFFIPELAV